MESRRASRIIVLDDEGRVLLFRFARTSGESYWATPGGGLEEGETFAEAAARETAEELGLGQVTLTPLWESTSEFPYGGRIILQEERFFLLRVQDIEFTQRVLDVHREEGILQARWWGVAELEDTRESVYPVSLPERVLAAIATMER